LKWPQSLLFRLADPYEDKQLVGTSRSVAESSGASTSDTRSGQRRASHYPAQMDPTRATSIAGPSSRGLYGDQSRRRPALLHRAQSGPILRHRSVTSPVLETRGGYHTSADMSHIISSEEDWSLFGDLFMSSAEPSEAFGSAHSPSSVAGATSGPDAISPISPILSEHSEPPHHSDLSTSSNSFSISSDPSSRPASPSETIRPPDSKVSQPHTLSNGFTSSFTPAPLPPPQAPPTKSILKLPQLTTLQRNILKCSVAYFIGSLFTFVPYLSGFLSDIVPFGSNEGPSPTGTHFRYFILSEC
jgi:hypothetical protein